MRHQTVGVLLAEDSEDDVLLIREAFRDTRLANLITVVDNGEDTLAYLRREGRFAEAPVPSLVLLDINMPRMNGFEVLSVMKSDSKLNHIPVVFLTTSDRDEDVMHSYSSGVCSYIIKPSRFSDFRRMMKHLALYWSLVASIPMPNGSDALLAAGAE